jgi:hypothetical protein
MPWCPNCRQEYTDVVKTCAECGAALVADLAAADAARAAAAERFVTVVAPAPMLAALGPWLAQAQVPARKLPDRDALSIPAAHAERVQAALEQQAEVEVEEDEIRVLGPRQDLEPQLPVDPEIVKKSTDELAAARGESIPKVLALFAAGTPRARKWALGQLQALEQRQVIALHEIVLWLAREGFRKPLFGLAADLAEIRPAGLAARLAAELAAATAPAALLLLHVLVQLRDRTVASRVLPLLSHDDPDVRAEADEVLMSATGFDARFEADAEPKEREQAIHLWREWIAKNPTS